MVSGGSWLGEVHTLDNSTQVSGQRVSPNSFARLDAGYDCTSLGTLGVVLSFDWASLGTPWLALSVVGWISLRGGWIRRISVVHVVFRVRRYLSAATGLWQLYIRGSAVRVARGEREYACAGCVFNLQLQWTPGLAELCFCSLGHA